MKKSDGTAPLVRLLLGTALVLAFAPMAAAQSITASPPTGPVTGVVTPAMHKFLGIPYAAPPVGSLRWKPPVPLAPWTTPLDASSYGTAARRRPHRSVR